MHLDRLHSHINEACVSCCLPVQIYVKQIIPLVCLILLNERVQGHMKLAIGKVRIQ